MLLARWRKGKDEVRNKDKDSTDEEIEKEEEENKTWQEKERVYIALSGGLSIRRNGQTRIPPRQT